MAKYIATGAAGTASATAATAGIVKVDNPSTAPITAPHIYEWSIGPGAAAEDSNYTVDIKRQTTAGTWTSVTPAPIDDAAAGSKATAGRASTAAGTASTIMGYWGFNQRSGIRWVAVPGGEFVVNRGVSSGIILEYAVVQGTAVNYGLIAFEE